MAEADNITCPAECNTAENRGGKFAVDHNAVVVDLGAAGKEQAESRCGEMTETFCTDQPSLEVFQMRRVRCINLECERNQAQDTIKTQLPGEVIARSTARLR